MPTDSQQAQPLLNINQLSKSFNATSPPSTVLHGIDLTVSRGEFLAIMGPSGSGKSTLLHTMSGMDRPTHGSVRFQNHELTTLAERQVSRLRLTQMGFVFQQAHFLPNLNIRDNVLLPALKASRTRAAAEAARQRVDALLEQFGLSNMAHHDTTEVSGGQLQRAALCRALATQPTVIFADEPTGALNRAAAQDVLNVLTEINRSGTTVILVTHDPVCAASAERIRFLVDGRITGTFEQGKWHADVASHRETVLHTWLANQGF